MRLRRVREINPTPGQAVFFCAQTLRDQIIALTGCDLDVFLQNPVIVFRILIDWDAFLVADHREDIKLLKRLNQEAERFIDIIKFHECRFDLPDTIPGRAGSWDGSGQHLGALLYNPGDHESYIIAGTAAPPTAVVSGLGLYLESGLQEGNEGLATSGEVGMLAKHALALFRDVLEASSETHRFVRAMTLLEFLASPNTMTKMQEVKKEIACHVAHDCASYQVVLERFKDLSHREIDGVEKGLRTLIVHHGKYLEDIVQSDRDRILLFRELQSYSSSVIRDMIGLKNLTWEEFIDFRKARRRDIGVSK